MGRHRYDYQWKEVQDINRYMMLIAYTGFVIRGIGILVVTWTTVVLLGGFVSMIDKHDFRRLVLITFIQMLWINVSFFERAGSSIHLLSSLRTVMNLLMRKRPLIDHAKLALVEPVVGAVRVVVGWVLLAVHAILLWFSITFMMLIFSLGLLITTLISIYELIVQEYYGDEEESRVNMDPAFHVLYVLCVAQGVVILYQIVLLRLSKRIKIQVKEAYGFRCASVGNYSHEILRECRKKPSSANKRNLVTYAIELIESKSSRNCLSGTLILDRLVRRQHSDQIKSDDNTVAQLTMKEARRKKHEERRKKKHRKREEAIIAQQRTVIKRLVGSASSTHILKKLLEALDPRRSYQKKMREAAASIVEHVAGGIRLEEFPRGLRCISSLIDHFEEYRRLQPYESSSLPPKPNEHNGDDQEQGSSSSSSSSESDTSSSDSELGSQYSESEPESDSYNSFNQVSLPKALPRYQDLVLTGLRILWSLAGSEDNCMMIINTKYLVPKIMAPVSYDLVHRTHHSSEWSTSVVEASMRLMLRLIVTVKDTKGDTGADLCQQMSNNEAITTMEKIVTCEECKGGKMKMTAMQILMQLSRCSFTKMLVELFIKGDCSDVSIKKTAGKELVMLFLSSKSAAALLPKEENDEFVRGLAEIVSQDGNDVCRKSAAEILEHMCIHYTENDEYLMRQKEKYDECLKKERENGEHLITLKNAMAGSMPKVLREILLGCGLTEKGKQPRYSNRGTDIESQVPTDSKTKKQEEKKSRNIFPFPWQNQHHKLYVALLSLYVTACEKLNLDIDPISPGEGDQKEGVAFRFAVRMVSSNRHHVTTDSLTVLKLSTRMVIATMMKLRESGHRVVKSAQLERLMGKLTIISKTMLDLEGSMVFAAGTTTPVPATADTLDSLVKRAQELHSKIKDQDSEIVPAS